jgi:peptide/nickel transport system substrate-binding protein
MNAPYASFVEQLSSYFYYLYVIPVGYDPKRPVGTGPFAYKSFAPGEQSYFTRYDSYFKSGLPHVDSVTITDFADATSQVNALTSGQIDAAGNIEGAQAKIMKSTAGFRVLSAKTGAMTPFTMRVDRPPFNDVRVRQAFRLIVDRPQLVSSALDGLGTVGNDVSSPYDPAYDKSLKRSQDIEQAKHLLKKAGQEKLTVSVVTAPIALGTVEAAQVFAEQAKAAGVNINVHQVTATEFFGSNYLSWTFSQDWWYYSPYLAQVAQELLPKSPYNETHWRDPHYVALYNEANRTLDINKRYEIEHEMQKIDFEEGGLIIASYNDVNDAYSDKLQGLQPASTGLPLMNYGFDQIWFS